MGREITEQQFKGLEQHHGEGMVLVLTDGVDEYAFRRPSDHDVDLALDAKEQGRLNFHEECALRCVLSPAAPAAGKSAQPKQKGHPDDLLPAEDRAAIIAERERLQALWVEAPFMRDWIGVGLSQFAGWSCSFAAEPIGGGRYAIAVRGADRAPEGAEISLTLTARRFTPAEYAEHRKRSMTMEEGAAERYAWRTLIDSANKDEVARLYPYLVISIGVTLQSLGSEGRRLAAKKFLPGSPQAPGSTTAPQATKET